MAEASYCFSKNAARKARSSLSLPTFDMFGRKLEFRKNISKYSWLLHERFVVHNINIDKSQMVVEEFNVLAPQACACWAEKVLALRRHWTSRHERLPFFTLGMAAYLDAGTDDAKRGFHPSYHSSILRQHSNQLLMQHFEELLEISRVALERRYNCNARYVPMHAALPGFHIHLPHPAFAADVASLHRDLQFMKVFSQTNVQPDQVLTFTLPLSLPPSTGLKTWNGSDCRLHLYQLGFMVAHNGLHPHQAVLHPESSGIPRIMLQGHGIFQSNELLLYW